MPSLRAVRTKIKSVYSIRKITSAMRMVAASKMKKAQERMLASRPYAHKILEVIAHLSSAHPEYSHPYLSARKIRRVGLIVITSDRGLCGALNINLLRHSDAALKKWEACGVEADLCLVGHKADAFFRRRDHVVVQTDHLGDQGGLERLIGGVKVMLDAYKAERIDALYMCFNQFQNTLVRRPQIQQLLPGVADEKQQRKYIWDYVYEPQAVVLLDQLLGRYIESQVYQSVVESLACEHAARIVAMQNASDNATHLIETLKLSYNKARQAIITNEISEIVAGVRGVR